LLISNLKILLVGLTLDKMIPMDVDKSKLGLFLMDLMDMTRMQLKKDSFKT